MPPDQAKQEYSRLRLILLCTVKQPWIADTARQVNPTLDNPTDYTVSENFIFVEPQELRLYDADSGKVFKTFTEKSVVAEHEQMFPIHLEVEMNTFTMGYLYYQIDDGPERHTNISNFTKPFLTVDAKSTIRVSGMDKRTLSKLVFRINGQVVHPHWYPDKHVYLRTTISEYRAVLQLP